jgi:hypothetical protein
MMSGVAEMAGLMVFVGRCRLLPFELGRDHPASVDVDEEMLLFRRWNEVHEEGVEMDVR